MNSIFGNITIQLGLYGSLEVIYFNLIDLDVDFDVNI